MLKKKCARLCVALFVLTSCAKVHFSNSEICADLGDAGAFCQMTLSDDSRDFTKEEWDEIRFGWLCMAPETWEELKASILKLCKETNVCAYEKVRNLLDQ